MDSLIKDRELNISFKNYDIINDRITSIEKDIKEFRYGNAYNYIQITESLINELNNPKSVRIIDYAEISRTEILNNLISSQFHIFLFLDRHSLIPEHKNVLLLRINNLVPMFNKTILQPDFDTDALKNNFESFKDHITHPNNLQSISYQTSKKTEEIKNRILLLDLMVKRLCKLRESYLYAQSN